jgi:hypothetical protein
MASTFLDLAAADIIDRIQAIASAAAGGPVVVRVGEEALGHRNVGIDLPAGRRSAAEGRSLRARMRAALEAGGVPLAENTLAPRVGGVIRGAIPVRETPVTWGDFSRFGQPPPVRR